MKFIYYGIILVCFSSILAMCTLSRDTGGRRSNPQRIVVTTTSPPVEKEMDPRKQEGCQSIGSGGVCEGDDDCEDICDDIFDGSRDRRACEEFRVGLVEEFETLLEDLEDGESDIDPDVLECLMDIDEEPVADAVRRMSGKEAEDFLIALSEDSDLAQVLEEEDNEGSVLRNLFMEAGKRNLQAVLGERDEDENFLYLVGFENNEYAFSYLENYVEDECEEEDGSDGGSECPGGEEIGAYCKGFLEWDEDDLEDFLDDSDVFADEYEDVVDDAEYAYLIDDDEDDEKGDFLDFCRVLTNEDDITSYGRACPSESNLRNRDLSALKAPLTTASSGEIITGIEIRNLCTGGSACGANEVQIVLTLSKNFGVLNFIYLENLGGDVDRIAPRCANGNQHGFCVSNNLDRSEDWFIYLAKRAGSNNCEFIAPYRELNDLEDGR